MKKSLTTIALCSAFFMSGCSEAPKEEAKEQVITEATQEASVENPLLSPSPLQYEAPVFDLIKDEHYLPAFEAAFAEHNAEIEAIANNPDAPTFENTMVAMEKSGQMLTRVSRIFFNLVSSSSNEERRNIQTELAPKLAAHNDNISLNANLFARVKSLYDDIEMLELDPESKRLLEVTYTEFVRAGANLNEEQKESIKAINQEMSELTTKFSQNLLAEGKRIAIVVDTVEELDGLSEKQIANAAKIASDAGNDGKYQINITNTTRQPILGSIKDRALRKRIWEASAYRAQDGEFDNTQITARVAQLRAQRAGLLGYDNWASYILEEQMAKTPEAVYDMLGSMVPAVVANTKKEAADIQALIDAEGGDFEVMPWDWAYYAEKVRKDKYDLDESEVRQYFEFNRVLEDGMFYTMNRLYGITFEKRDDLPVYHPDVQAYEVFDVDGSSIAIFYADYFAREGKRGGAWMSSFVSQSKLLNKTPVVVNVMNIEKAPEGQPTLVSYNHVTTMFHEIGHAIHGIFSNVNYPSLAGTAVSTDYVEFPSTYEEDWAAYPEVIENYAKHYKTGEAIPKELLDKVIKSRSFNMGFNTLEYMSASLLDMEWHTLSPDSTLQDTNKFEEAALEKHGVNLTFVPPRYKTSYFAHSMGGYSARYYAYMWSEILAADAFAYVQTMGGLTFENGSKYRKEILETGNSRPVMESYKAFRGQEPTTDALLKRRGLKLDIQ